MKAASESAGQVRQMTLGEGGRRQVLLLFLSKRFSSKRHRPTNDMQPDTIRASESHRNFNARQQRLAQ